jgi:drug/metabolite transporter (DMT)-like permease
MHLGIGFGSIIHGIGVADRHGFDCGGVGVHLADSRRFSIVGSTYAWVNPMIAVLSGARLEGESFLRSLVVGGLILFSVGLILAQGRSRRALETKAAE